MLWRTILLLVMVLLMAGATQGETADLPVNKNWRSIAIGGYDTVVYFTLGKAIKGTGQFEHRWRDARWRFASADHLALFAKNPDQYAPRFGRYCAEGMSRGRTAIIDPEAWLIIDDERYHQGDRS